MRRSTQTPAFPGTSQDNPSRLPWPQNPVGHARVHTPRHDSRQWSVSSASKSRQNSLVASRHSSLASAVSPTTSRQASLVATDQEALHSTREPSHQRFRQSDFAADTGLRGTCRRTSLESVVSPSALPIARPAVQRSPIQQITGVKSKQNPRAPLPRTQRTKTSRIAKEGPEPGTAQPDKRFNPPKRNFATGTTRGRALAPAAILTEKDHAQRSSVYKTKANEYAPGPDFMCLSSGSEGKASPDPELREIDLERVHETHEQLEEIMKQELWALNMSSFPPSQANASNRSRSLCVPRSASNADGRPAWANIGHFRNVSWPSERYQEAENAVATVPERRRSSSESPDTRVRRGTGIFPHTPIRAPRPVPPERSGSVQPDTEQDDMLRVPESETPVQESMLAPTETFADALRAEKVSSNGPKQSRFVEHLPENEEVLKRMGFELEPTRRQSGGSWLKSLKKRRI